MASTCTSCGKPGIPYEYKGQVFDGLCAYHGDRLCPACRDARMDAEGVSILVVDGRPSIPPYIWNSVADRDKVQIWIPPELRGIDGRDRLPRRRRGRGNN